MTSKLMSGIHISFDYGDTSVCGLAQPEKWLATGLGTDCEECYRKVQEIIDTGRTADGRYRNIDYKK